MRTRISCFDSPRSRIWSSSVGHRTACRGRRGFTLIEMLVSAALVVLIMSLFAQIFALATTSIADQRTIARHDQKARMLTQTLKTDLDSMTFRQRGDASGWSRGIVPLHPQGPQPDSLQRGYFYYSENEPGNGADDVLQFTVDLSFGSSRRLTDVERTDAPIKYVGRAQQIGRPDLDGTLSFSEDPDLVRATGEPDVGSAIAKVGASIVQNDFLGIAHGLSGGADINQPTGDVGDVAGSQTASATAEVSYFLRGGNLYRRVLLLRDPPGRRGSVGQPSLGRDGSGGLLLGRFRAASGGLPDLNLPGDYTRLNDIDDIDFDVDESDPTHNDPGHTFATDFWGDFDISATRFSYDPANTAAVGDDLSAIYVHSVDSLNNISARRPLGHPSNRFGHFPDSLVDRRGAATIYHAAPGQPFEFLRGSGTGFPQSAQFIGRFTHGETSYRRFNWPGQSRTTNSPLNRLDLVVSDASNGSQVGDGAITFTGPRVGEDLILGNVVQFDVKVWDDSTSDFVDLGSPLAGMYNSGSRVFSKNNGSDFGLEFRASNPGSPQLFGYTYGPTYDGTLAGRLASNVFDTWHPNVDGMVANDLDSDNILDIDTGEHFITDGVPDPPPVWARASQLFFVDVDGTDGFIGANDFGSVYDTVEPTVPRFEYTGVWDTNRNYQTGDIVIPDVTLPPYATSGAYTTPRNARLASSAFVCTVSDGGGGSGGAGTADGDLDDAITPAFLVGAVQQPNWEEALINGLTIDRGDGEDTMVWRPISGSDAVGLKKLQVTITVRDPKSETLRDVTLLHSFVE